MARPRKEVKIGETKLNNQGYKMKLIEYINIHDITVEFEDGYIKKSSYKSFKNGCIRNPNVKKRYDEKIGETNYNSFGSKMTIVKCEGLSDITVEFENGYRKRADYNSFLKGSIKSPYEKRAYGVGYLGEGKYKTKENGKFTPQFKRWRGMIVRCYDVEIQAKKPAYKDCAVCEEWHNFQNFAKWYDENYYEIPNEVVALDKDLFSNGNKVYSPSTCIFLPVSINSTLTTATKNKSGCVGVSYNKNKKKWVVRISKYNKEQYLGTFNSFEEASNVYRNERRKYLIELVESYKDKIPSKVYLKLYSKITEHSEFKEVA